MTNDLKSDDVIANNQVNETEVKAARERLHKYKKFSKKPLIIAVAVIVIIAVIITVVSLIRGTSAFGLFKGDFKTEQIKELSLYNAKGTQDTENLKAQDSFKVGDPILLKATFKPKGQESVYLVSIERNGEEYRKNSLPVSLEEGTTEAVRYIGIVTSKRTALEPGRYIVRILDSDNKEVLKQSFTVTEN